MELTFNQLIEKINKLKLAVPHCNNVEVVDYDNNQYFVDNVTYDPGTGSVPDAIVITLSKGV